MNSSSAVINVPFRCPDCGDSVKFETLKELRMHLESHHVDFTAKNIQGNLQPSRYPNIFNNNSASPILEMYHADAIRIEEDLLNHKRNELNNKQRRMNGVPLDRNLKNVGRLQRSTIQDVDRDFDSGSASFRIYGHSGRMEHKYLNKPQRKEVVSRHIQSQSQTLNKTLYDDQDGENLEDVTVPINIPEKTVYRGSSVPPVEKSVKKMSNQSINVSRMPSSVSSEMDNHVRETLTALSQEVVASRANQYATVDSLLASQEVYAGLEHSAQEKISKQQEIIARLALKLSEKDEKLVKLTLHMNSQKNQATEDDVKTMIRNVYNEQTEKLLQEELSFKQRELMTLSGRLESARAAVVKCEEEIKDKNEELILNTKDNVDQQPVVDMKEEPVRDNGLNVHKNTTNTYGDLKDKGERVPFQVSQAKVVERDMQAKEKELVSLRSKSMQLESDRQTLLLEMQALLEIAAKDNEKLRAELADQGKQLSKLNLELERSKQEQSELLGETNTLYFQADVSLSRLKHVLEERDTQLSSVSAQLEQAKDMQDRLTKERQEYLNAATEKESRYQALVHENALQLQNMKESLKNSQVEKEKLQEKLKEMKRELDRKEKEDEHMEQRMKEMETQLDEQEAWQVDMRKQIRNKEDRLQKAKSSMDQMSFFMSDTAQQELDARSRLEQFISSLIERSTQTESELQKLRKAYAAKEETLKNVMEAQERLTSQTNLLQDLAQEATWQHEAQAEIKNLSASPKSRSYSIPNSTADISQRSGPSFHHPPPHHPDYIPGISSEEPIRLRSSINHVRETDTMETVPERQLKNRPILVMGKEYPHPSAYGIHKPRNEHSKSVGFSTQRASSQERNRQHDSAPNISSSGALYKDAFYLPVEHDEISPRSFPQSHNSPNVRDHSPNNTRARNFDNDSTIFRNTPEVQRMYQNVQKNSYPSNPVNQLMTKSSSNYELNSTPERSRQLPMDEQGIIWEPYDKFSPRPRVLKKKVRRKSSHKLNKRESSSKNVPTNGYRGADSDGGHGSNDSDDNIQFSRKRNGKTKPGQHPFLQKPAPLGDKIALLLTSMAPASPLSSARRDYAESVTSRQGKEGKSHGYYSPSESDSPQSSPLHVAKAVQQRVEKLTQAREVDRAWSPTPKARNRPNVSSQPLAGQSLAQPSQVKPSSGTHVERREDMDVSQHTHLHTGVLNASGTTGSPYHTLNESRSLPHLAEYQNEKDLEKDEEKEISKSQNDLPLIAVEEYDNNRMVDPDMDEAASVESQNTVLYRSASQAFLLNPASDFNEQLDSHNAESEFSSSSYADLKTEPQDVGEETQAEDETDMRNERKVFVQVHQELEPRASLSSVSRDDSRRTDSMRSPSQDQVSDKSRRMSRRESFAQSKHSDSTRSMLRHQDSRVMSSEYDDVMKELIKKHPYIDRNSLDQTEKSDYEPQELVTENQRRSFESMPDDDYYRRESSEFEHVDVPVSNSFQEEEQSDHGVFYSDQEDGACLGKMEDSQSRQMSREDSRDLSSDTDLEKLAKPGNLQKPLSGKKKKKNLSGMKKDKNSKKQKSAQKLKDVAKSPWSSVDPNDPEEIEREERLQKRRLRVAVFCALAWADTKTLLNASQVCKEWRKIAQHPALWKNVELKDSAISSEFLITLSQWCTQTETLSLQGLTARPQKLLESEKDYHSATRGSLEPGLERLLFSCQGSLSSLRIEGCENILTDKCLWMVSSNCRMLTHLNYRSRLDPVNPQLMWALGGGCPGITSLHIHPYPDSSSTNAMNNRCLLQIGQFYRDLQEVGLGGMEFNMAGLLPLIQSCQHLTAVHMDSCIAFTDDLATALCRAGLKDLHTFTITNTAIQAKAIQTLQGNCRHLKRIHVTVTPQSCGLNLAKKKEKDEYKKLIKGYTDLKKKAGLSHILTLDIEDPE